MEVNSVDVWKYCFWIYGVVSVLYTTTSIINFVINKISAGIEKMLNFISNIFSPRKKK